MNQDRSGKVNTPAQMVTPIQPITDDLPKKKPADDGFEEEMGGLKQEQAAEVMEEDSEKDIR